MSLDAHFNNTMELLLDNYSHQITIKQIINSLDLTQLGDNPSLDELLSLKRNANQHQVAAVCVHIHHLQFFTELSSINLATVINFPQGNEDLKSSLTAIEKAARCGAVEIDYVFPYERYLKGEKNNALQLCKSIIEMCKKHHLILKIILETGIFPDSLRIYNLSRELIELGCDFIKTSTGKIAQGASLSAAFAILSAIKDTNSRCGIKLSGGVKTPRQAFHYTLLAELVINKPINKTWFRIGASSLLDELLKNA